MSVPSSPNNSSNSTAREFQQSNQESGLFMVTSNDKTSSSATNANASVKEQVTINSEAPIAYDNKTQISSTETKSPRSNGNQKRFEVKSSLEANVVSAVNEEKMNENEEEIEIRPQNAHALTWEQVAELLETNAEKGLSRTEAQSRLEKFGTNNLAEAPPEPFWHKLFRQINSILIYILLVAAAIAAGFQQWAECGLILGVIAINVTIGLIQEGKAERATAALKAMLSSKANVIRDGVRTEINAEYVVPGDVVFIESGNRVPADIRLISVSNLAIQESILTGESLPVNKKTIKLESKLALGDRKNMAFSATSCIKGQGCGIVVSTGNFTEIGKINQSVSEVKEQRTQLLRQIDAFGIWIGLMVLPIAIASFLLAFFSPKTQYDVANAFIEAVAIAVAIVPEGLPAVITITLSLATSHLARHHAIVKALPSVETLGSVTVICSDKTGTLTKNEMTVVEARTAKNLYKVHMVGYDPVGGKVTIADEKETPLEFADDPTFLEMVKGGVLCNDSRLEIKVVKDTNFVNPIGDPTEVALCTLSEKVFIHVDEIRKKYPRIGVIPFESEHKFMCTFHAHLTDSDSVIVYVKGAPDRLVNRCSQQNASPNIETISTEFWQVQAAELSEKGLRCLAICTATIPKSELPHALAQGAAFITEANQPFLSFLGIAAIMDPPRQECVDAIKEAHSAGIVVKMITGDHPGTAKAIAKQLGILEEQQSMIMTGPEMNDMSIEQLREVVLKCNVYARAAPENKISIVRALQAERQVCSMTGDGVNDAPALRAADIGVAMGITGTDVSKDAAKMILTDDNFATILVAVKAGRTVWDNLRKILIFNMPASFAQGGVVFFALCLQWQTVPLSAIQILYVNMITAATLGLMLAVEPPEVDIMQRPPRKQNARLIGSFFYWRSFFVGVVFIVFVLGSVAWLNVISSPYTVTQTENVTFEGIVYVNSTNITVYAASEGLQHAIALNTLVFCETTYAFNCRFLQKSSLHYRVFFGNSLAWVCAFLMIGLQFMITYIPGLNAFFSMEDGMTGPAWGITILFAVLSFLVVEFEKFLQPYLGPHVLRLMKRVRRYCTYSSNCCSCFKCCLGLKEKKYDAVRTPKRRKHLPVSTKSGASLRFVPEEFIQDEA